MIPLQQDTDYANVDRENLGQLFDRQVVARLGEYIRPHWRRLAMAAAAMFVHSAAAVAVPWLVRQAIDSYIQTDNLAGLNSLLLIFLLVATLGAAGSYMHHRLLEYVSQQVLYALRVRMFRHLQYLSMSYFDRNEAGRIMSRVQYDVQQLQGMTAMVVVSLAEVLTLGGVVAVMFGMNQRLALITLAVVVPLIGVWYLWQRLATDAYRRAQESLAELNSRLLGTLTGIRVVQSLNQEPESLRRLAQAQAENVEDLMRIRHYTAVLPAIVEVLGAASLALVVYFGGTMALDESIEIGIVVAFALYIERFFGPIRTLTLEYTSTKRAMASGARIFEFLDLRPDVVDRPNAIVPPPLRGDVRFEGVEFHYTPGITVLEGLSFNVRAGETVALVGLTGAGKTTTVSLLMRLYDVKGGMITIDGNDIRDLRLDSLTSQIGIVPQEPFLFSGTVKENIRYNHLRVTDDEIVKAATAVGADEFISRMEQGYDTQLQERGSNLSIGQRQLISFARALAADPKILILDEATAHVDTGSELQIQRALDELLEDRTALVIAHRLSTVRRSDRIIVLDRGCIVEQGSHDQLMEIDGLYSRLQSYTEAGLAT